MIPCAPPMMLVSIVGHAIFQTARESGPDTIDRSYRPDGGAGAAGAAACSPVTQAAGSGSEVSKVRERCTGRRAGESSALEPDRNIRELAAWSPPGDTRRFA